MNPQLNITAHQNRLDSDSEGVYDYNFFMGLDGVAAALDNVESSEDTYFVLSAFVTLNSHFHNDLMKAFTVHNLQVIVFCCPGVYLDRCCVLHQKPLLEGGTLGSKGSTLVVVPHLTESYGSDTSSSKNAIPLCTLKNFPHRIEHTLQVLLIKSK